MKTAIITGGAGFVASHLAEKISYRFDKIYLIDNLVRTKSFRNIEHLLQQDKYEFIYSDLLDINDIGTKLSNVDGIITEVYHLAATRINRCAQFSIEGHNYNTTAGYNIINWVAHHPGVRFFLASSASVYNRPERLPIHEDDFIQPRTIYGAAKYYLEGICRSMLKEGTYKIGRFFSIYGERMDNEGAYTEIIFRWLNNVMSGNTELIVYGDPKKKELDLIYVTDIVNAINLMMTKESNYTEFNVSSGFGTSLVTLRDIIENVTATSLSFKFLPENRSDIEKVRYGDTTRIQSLGWKRMITRYDGIEKTYQWLKQG